MRSNATDRVFDSWALLAWIQNEPAADAVEAFILDARRGTAALSLSSINAGEIYYQLVRRQGQELAEAFWRDVVSGRFPLRLFSATDARVRRAARLKAQFPIAYADAFAIALALELQQPLVTGGAEIGEAAAECGVTLEWLG